MNNGNIYLFNKINNKIEAIDEQNIIDMLYNAEINIPTTEQINNHIKKYKDNITKFFKSTGIDEGLNEIKNYISNIENKIPLYDAYSDNMYVINKFNVYDRVIYHSYRFPDNNLLENIKDKKKKLEIKISNNKYTEEDSILKNRKLRKYELMIDFLEQFNLEKLFSTYIRVFYLYANEVGKNITLCQKPSFVPQFNHVKPYYSRSEVLNLALNMGMKLDDTYYDMDMVNSLCKKIKDNDISAKILLQHQEHIIKQNKVGLIQYYSLHGSYHMNQYLRGLTEYQYRNTHLEKLIKPMWELVYSAPAFNKDYILYRFVSNDSYLRELNIGDIFTEDGFMSTTRDPFYRSDLYKFGFILMKIKIPKNVIGVGLCIETLSHFPHEQEIILPPLSMLRLDKRDDKCVYYNTDEKFASQVKTRYEFTFVGKGEIKFVDRPTDPKSTPIVDFLSIKTESVMTVSEKIKIFMKNNLNSMNQFEANIGDKKFTINSEMFDSTGAYKQFYSLTTDSGLSIYCIHNNYVLFFIEIGSDRQMRVNYYVKYSTIDRKKVIDDNTFIYFISTIAHYFEISKVFIFADHLTCDTFVKEKSNKKIKVNISQIIKETNQPIQRGFAEKKENKQSVNKMDDDQYTIYGGSYCTDYYDYLKTGKKRYSDIKILNVELAPSFSYYDLDKLKKTNPLKILNKLDKDELFQIYDKTYKDFVDTKNDNIGDFIIWIIENKCYMVEPLEKKMIRLGKDNNIFQKDIYILDSATFLYNRKFVMNYPQYIIDNSEEVKRNSESDTEISIRGR